MLCKRPLTIRGLPVGCGQCLHCKINRRRLWTVRLLLEAQSHNTASFLTLTYEQEPAGRSLCPRDLSLFNKRLWAAIQPIPFRYFACGEYGDQFQRPHYHLVVFSLGPTAATEELVYQTWLSGDEWKSVPQKPGFITVRPFDENRAAYVAGYVVAKLKGKRDLARLNGRLPEFARMSRNPGLGFNAALDVASALSGSSGQTAVQRLGDVPPILRCGSQWWLLDRYLKGVIRDELGIEASEARLQGLKDQVQAVRARSLAHSHDPSWYLVDHAKAEMKEHQLNSIRKRGQL